LRLKCGRRKSDLLLDDPNARDRSFRKEPCDDHEAAVGRALRFVDPDAPGGKGEDRRVDER